MDKERIGKLAKAIALRVGKNLLDSGKKLCRDFANQSEASKRLSEDELIDQYKWSKSGTFGKGLAKRELKNRYGYTDEDLKFLDKK